MWTPATMTALAPIWDSSSIIISFFTSGCSLESRSPSSYPWLKPEIKTCWPNPTLSPRRTGPIMTEPIPTRALFPIMTCPAPLFMVVKSSIRLFLPTINWFHGNTSMRELLLRMIAPFPFWCIKGFIKHLIQKRGRGLVGCDWPQDEFSNVDVSFYYCFKSINHYLDIYQFNLSRIAPQFLLLTLF